MEVKNQMVDQMLVNAVAQPPANANAKPAKDAEQNDFGSMVNQKRSESEKPEAKQQKTEQKPEDGAQDAKPATEQPADEKYAIAAAMMYQAMPNPRAATVQTEEAVTIEAPQMQQLTVEPELAETVTETVEAPVEQTVDVARTVRTDVQPVAPEVRTEIETPRLVRADAPEETADEDNTETAQTMQETPVFEHVEAPVVKVAEVSHPIPLEAEDGVEQLGNELNLVVNSVDANRVEVTLTPEHLGKLTVEITRGTDGTLNVVLHTTTERAANLLDRGADGLRQMLAANSEREVQVQVRGSEETQQQFLNPDGRNDQENRQQQQQNRRRDEQRSTQDFLQQLRLGLVDVDDQT